MKPISDKRQQPKLSAASRISYWLLMRSETNVRSHFRLFALVKLLLVW